MAASRLMAELDPEYVKIPSVKIQTAHTIFTAPIATFLIRFRGVSVMIQPPFCGRDSQVAMSVRCEHQVAFRVKFANRPLSVRYDAPYVGTTPPIASKMSPTPGLKTSPISMSVTFFRYWGLAFRKLPKLKCGS